MGKGTSWQTYNSRVLLNTPVYYIGLHFAIRGEKHRKLRHNPSQIQLVEPTGGTLYLVFMADVSKTNQGGPQHLKQVPKQVVHHLNAEAPECCLVQLFLLYNSKCYKNRPEDAFYLKPLVKPRGDVWYTCMYTMFVCCWPQHSFQDHPLPIKAGLEGNYTNHSLRATAAT